MNTVGSADIEVCYPVPFGVLGIRTNSRAVTGLTYLPADSEPSVPENAFVREVLRQIDSYLADPSFVFDLPLEFDGSEFRKKVWKVMCEIPAGKTLTYGEVAQRLGSAPRAVGGACGDNRIPLIIPCHRVVARNGIGGFMHTTGDRELGVKRWLLAHEKSMAAELF